MTNLEAIAAVPLFAGLGLEERSRAAELLIFREYEQGSYLLNADEPAPGLFAIRSGIVALHRGQGSRRWEARSGGEGEIIAELAICAEFAASSFPVVRAQTAVTAFLLRREDFVKLIEREPAIAMTVMNRLARRVDEAQFASSYSAAPPPPPDSSPKVHETSSSTPAENEVVRAESHPLIDAQIAAAQSLLTIWRTASGRPIDSEEQDRRKRLVAELGGLTKSYSTIAAKLLEEGVKAVKSKLKTQGLSGKEGL